MPTLVSVTSSRWTAADLPSFSGRTVVVTGANSGIGLVASRELARAGARVVMAVRDIAKGEQAAATVTGEREVRRLDLADLSSVRAFAGEWDGDIDVLVNNAGVMAIPLSRTADGIRDAVRHQSSRSLRTDEPAPAACHRSRRHSGIRRAPRRQASDFDDPNWNAGKYQLVGGIQPVQAGQSAVHTGAAATTRGGRLRCARLRRASRVFGDQPAIAFHRRDRTPR